MQLNELLEENSTKTISQRTNIAEENIERLLNSDFAAIKRVKTLGFISILEREYKVDLEKLREEALAYYEGKGEDESVTIGLPIIEEKKKRSKWIWVVVAALLGYASWYFFTEYDRSQLESLLPFNEAKSTPAAVPAENVGVNEGLSIQPVIPAKTDESTEPAGDNEMNSSENY